MHDNNPYQNNLEAMNFISQNLEDCMELLWVSHKGAKGGEKRSKGVDVQQNYPKEMYNTSARDTARGTCARSVVEIPLNKCTTLLIII